MVESMIGLLRQDQSFMQATRCYEGFLSDSKISVVSSLPIAVIFIFTILLFPWLLFSALLFSALMSRNNSPCDTVFPQRLFLLQAFGWLHNSHFSLAIIGCKGSQNLIRM
ncbi:hypothetical protein [Yersinia alsatica]|uniref:hypothetical protein n=1 Tax=Yersinia alsatica TaxID=2890317 RepID=UPI0011AA9E94|nr:hypothetical protein [Yersinia alsatica]